MSDVNIQLVREFFELNAFHVMTCWQHDSGSSRGTDQGLQLLVHNTAAAEAQEPPFVLRPGDAASLDQAIVEVRAWHADRLYASVIESNPVLFEVANEESRTRARTVFGSDTFKTVLVVSELPAFQETRQRSVALLEQSGIDHVLEFPTVLHELLDKVSAGISYSSSITLQTLRLLKRYDFIRYQQMEFPFSSEPPAPATPYAVETSPEPPESAGGVAD